MPLGAAAEFHHSRQPPNPLRRRQRTSHELHRHADPCGSTTRTPVTRWPPDAHPEERTPTVMLIGHAAPVAQAEARRPEPRRPRSRPANRSSRDDRKGSTRLSPCSHPTNRSSRSPHTAGPSACPASRSSPDIHPSPIRRPSDRPKPTRTLTRPPPDAHPTGRNLPDAHRTSTRPPPDEPKLTTRRPNRCRVPTKPTIRVASNRPQPARPVHTTEVVQTAVSAAPPPKPPAEAGDSSRRFVGPHSPRSYARRSLD